MTSANARYDPAARAAPWHFVLGRSFAAAVEATAAPSVLDALWWLAETEYATLESVVGAFPLAGLDEVRSFAVVSFGEFAAGASETTITAVIRGSGCVDIFSVGGARRFRSEGVQPWVLADFRSVTGLTLCADDRPTNPFAVAGSRSLPLGLGIVAGDALVWSLSPIEVAARADEDEAAAASVVPEAVSRADGPLDTPDGVDGDTIIAEHRRHSAVIDPAPENHSPSLFGHASAPDSPPRMPLTRAFPQLAPIPPAPLRDTRKVQPRRQSDGESHPMFGIRIDGRETLLLDVPTIIGRNPHPPRIAEGISPRLVVVPSPELVVSSTHVELEQVGDAVVATDLRSTNGTFVRNPGAPRERLHPGESRVLLPGATLEIGDGNIIEITPT